MSVDGDRAEKENDRVTVKKHFCEMTVYVRETESIDRCLHRGSRLVRVCEKRVRQMNKLTRSRVMENLI